MNLCLEASEVAGPAEWRWTLADDTGPLATRQVRLDTGSWQYEAFTDLHRYLSWNAAPDRRAASEAELLAQVGVWVKAEVLGEDVSRLGAAATSTVRVVVPADAEFLLYQPLDLAFPAVDFVFEVPGAGGGTKQPAVRAVRMLAVFSLPHRATALGQHRERRRLTHAVRQIGRAVELKVVQYGVTRSRLAEIVADGWDVVHLSGHGGAGVFALEAPDGSVDLIGSGDLETLLRPMRDRVKLVVVSACESAAVATAHTRQLLGVDDSEAAVDPAVPATGLALALGQGLRCPVVAMRYPVDDVFATAFAEHFYRRLFVRPAPLELVVRQAVGDSPGPPLSMAAPAVFTAGPSAELVAPVGQSIVDTNRLAHFPPEPERFVGRVELMAKAGALLAAGSGRPALLLHGMAGAGKSACALELAYRHQESFQALVFWQAPTQDDETGAALADLAIRLESQVPGLAMVDTITTTETLARFVPVLTELLENHRLLFVLDNLETLLTTAGRWRDPRWEPLVAAFASHRGPSRTILTSRVPPTRETRETLETLRVHALSGNETLLLTRELPNLGRMLHPSAAVADGRVVTDRYLVRRVLDLVHGHPKLLELADATAADRRALVTRLNAAEAYATAHGIALTGYFHAADDLRSEAEFVQALGHWTLSTLDALPEPAQLLTQYLAWMQTGDRQRLVLLRTWESLWQRRQAGPAPALDPLVDLVAGTALMEVHDNGFALHPGVAGIIRAHTGEDLRRAFDHQLASWWHFVFGQAADREGAEDTRVLVRAALSSVPYLFRLGMAESVLELMTMVVVRDRSPAVVQEVLAVLRRIVGAGYEPAVGVMADVLRTVDPVLAERLLRREYARAVAEQDHQAAARHSAGLFNLLRDAGRLEEALALIEEVTAHARAARLGPWSQLFHQGGRLQILGLIGRHDDVLAGVAELRAQMAGLSLRNGENDPAESWAVRELVLDAGCESALALRDWSAALEFNQERCASMRSRGAPARELARAVFKDFGPLIELDRIDVADRLLRDCQRTFEDLGDIAMLVPVFGARALVEYVNGRLDAGLDLQHTALRLGYASGNVREIATAHNNIATFMNRLAADPVAQIAHRLAAALLHLLMGQGFELGSTVRSLVDEHPEGLPELTSADVVELVQQVDGVRFGEVITGLADNQETLSAALADVLRRADELRG